MQQRLVFCVLVTTLFASRAEALWTHLSGADPEAPFDISYQADPETPLELILQIGNTSAATESILSWQLQLKLQPTNGAEGNLLFVPHVSAPPDSLFGPDLGPIDFMDENPSTEVLCLDATFEETGEPISPDESRNIVRLTITAEPGTSGVFELAMQELDPETTDGSSWFDEATYLPAAFENSVSSGLPGYFLLGTIEVEAAQTVLVGDYNSDEKVSAADFTVWRDHVGAATLDNRDPDNSGPVNSADFESWKESYGSGLFGSGAGAAGSLPEPSCLALLLNVGLVMSLPRLRRGLGMPLGLRHN